MTATLAITMAGRGQRFRDAGFDVPKYEIEVRGRSLFRWAMASLRSWTDAGAQFVFLAREEDDAAEFIARECAAEGIEAFAVVPVQGTTDGQATTALLAAASVRDRTAPFAIYNIDTHVRAHAMRAEAARGDGWIPCFPGEGDGWSFAALGEGGRVSELREKVRISPHATVGLYWFGSFETYAELYERHFATAGDERGERYVAPMYNTLIAGGGSVHIAQLEPSAVVPLGTPAEVERFMARG